MKVGYILHRYVILKMHWLSPENDFVAGQTVSSLVGILESKFLFNILHVICVCFILQVINIEPSQTDIGTDSHRTTDSSVDSQTTSPLNDQVGRIL